MTRRVSWLEAFHVWGINLIGNLAGSLLVAWIIKMSGLLNNEQFGTFVVTTKSVRALFHYFFAGFFVMSVYV